MGGVPETGSKVERGRLHKVLAQLFNDKVLNRLGDLVTSHCFEKDHLLERVQFFVPLSRHGFQVSFRCIKDLLEFLVVLDEVGVDSRKGRQLSHNVKLSVNLAPLQIVEPVRRVRCDVDGARRSRKEESPFSRVDRLVSEQNLHSE